MGFRHVRISILFPLFVGWMKPFFRLEDKWWPKIGNGPVCEKDEHTGQWKADKFCFNLRQQSCMSWYRGIDHFYQCIPVTPLISMCLRWKFNEGYIHCRWPKAMGIPASEPPGTSHSMAWKLWRTLKEWKQLASLGPRYCMLWDMWTCADTSIAVERRSQGQEHPHMLWWNAGRFLKGEKLGRPGFS